MIFNDFTNIFSFIMKDFKKQEIRNLLETLNEQVEQLLNYEQMVPQIEIDIVKGNLQKLYDEINYINLTTEEKTVDVSSGKDYVEPEAVAEEVDKEAEELIDIAEEEFDDSNKETETASEVSVPEKKSSPVFEIPDKQEPEEHQAEPEPVKQETKKSEPVKQDENKSVHQIAAEKSSEKTLGENISTNAISSLKKYISINDKFQFANELFDGKMRIYNEKIAALDSLTSFDDASKMIESLIKEYDWDTESEIFRQFFGYIQRRFKS